MYYQDYQVQEQINKQKQEQKLDMEYNIEHLGHALSKCEFYVLRFGKVKDFKPIFSYYNRFNNANEREKLDLYKSIVNAVKIFKYGIEETKIKYGIVLYPNNMTKEQIIEYIKKLISYLKEEREESIFIDLIKIIEGTEVNFDKYKRFFNSNSRMEPKTFMEAYSHINRAIESKELNWINQIQQNQNYEPHFHLNQNFENDSTYQDYMKHKEYKSDYH